jgi:hypothetical protein
MTVVVTGAAGLGSGMTCSRRSAFTETRGRS